MTRLYPVTIFLSAFLLFQVEPIITKIILPWFGGSASVWTVCLLFFQLALLLGYLYAHLSVRCLTPRLQGGVHIALLAISLAALPIFPSAGLKPHGSDDPTWKILELLLLTVGLPFFLLSTTGPLVQAWFAADVTRRAASNGTNPRGKAHAPYRLYALSNLGSMLALLTYPVLVEPVFTTRQQSLFWSMAYGVFIVCCGLLAWQQTTRGVSSADIDETGEASAPAYAASAAHVPQATAPAPGLYLLWILLAACSSALLLAVTTHMSQNIAAIPFLWILPLSLYLLSFIICFGPARWRWSPAFLPFPALLIAAMAYLLENPSGFGVRTLIPVFALGMFVCCVLCHGELARLKPNPRYLTSFYLMISLGGALGGLFVGVLAPLLFRNYYELPITIVACALFATGLLYRPRSRRWWWDLSWLALVGLTALLGLYFVTGTVADEKGYRLIERNFYGVLKVSDSDVGTDDAARTLTYGVITHGVQFLDPKRRMTPTTYYGRDSGVGLALRIKQSAGPVRIGVIGLGTGTIAAYGRPGDTVHYYEINPLVLRLAHSQFSFLDGTKAATVVTLGDARLSLESEPDQRFDVLAVDAFSGDAIPVHLLTRQAFALYFRHLKPDGILAVHVSNLYLDLAPIAAMLAEEAGWTARDVLVQGDEDKQTSTSEWVLINRAPSLFKSPLLKDAGEPVAIRKDLRPWTDDYSNLYQILSN